MAMAKARTLNQPSRASNTILNIIAAVFSIACVFPFLFVIIISFTNEKALSRDGYRIIPKEWSLEAYRYIFKTGDQLLRSFGITVLITVVGALLSLILISHFAYAISRSSFRYRNFFSFIAIFTMLFNGGMVPSYIINTRMLHLKDTLWALILPLAVNAFYIMIMRTFYRTTVPDAIVEAGKIDGAGELRVFYSVVLPISLPGLATIGLFSTLGYWNDWFNALLYIDNPNLVPLQALLMRIENSMQFLVTNSALSGSGQGMALLSTLPQDSARMAMVVLATVPIVLAYPFFQRFFISGLTVGAVKG
ncbi:carbohydrate ABC transporter permease [Paenibacillus chibensis]|uniref:Carbohydrate ABC transporter permease n=1 Tax=Paenibacillus chibensis TaxID=59846 RepID=A0ABU6PVS8_9BACL|nr:carbohydrate ABC transporter permease [Paenibacillus chibensis]MEC0371177.1 carbohydrate ABC transporter permease [Paenibacillus chibensis]MED5018213.1 carbohydrate ABC transporter permease [Paenibacillus chibensis]